MTETTTTTTIDTGTSLTATTSSSQSLATTENFIYLGRIEPVHYFLHVVHVEREISLVQSMSADVYNCMIHACEIAPGQKVIVFNVLRPKKCIVPVLVNHVLFGNLTGIDSAVLRTVLLRLLVAPRDANQLAYMIVARFGADGRPTRYDNITAKLDLSILASMAKSLEANATDAPMDTVQNIWTNKPLTVKPWQPQVVKPSADAAAAAAAAAVKSTKQ